MNVGSLRVVLPLVLLAAVCIVCAGVWLWRARRRSLDEAARRRETEFWRNTVRPLRKPPS